MNPRASVRAARPCGARARRAASFIVVAGAALRATSTPAAASGQPPTPVPGLGSLAHHRHDAWRTEQGLPQSWVSRVVQTPDGYLWLGTLGGLARFDGARFTVFDRATTPSLPSNGVQPVLVERGGGFWVSTDNQRVARYDGRVFTTYDSTRGVPAGGFVALCEDRGGTVWGGAAFAGGLYRLAGGRFVPHRARAGRVAHGVRALACARSGAVWAGTAGGVYRLARDTVTRLTVRDGLPDSSVWSLLEDGRGAVWAGTDNGLARVADGRVAASRLGVAPGIRVAVLALTEGARGDVWAGTEAHGLYRVPAGRLTGRPPDHYGESDGLTNDVVFALARDREGNVWAGTRAGLDRFREPPFVSLLRRDGLPTDAPGALYADDGGLWVAPVTGGLARWAGGDVRGPAVRGLAADRVLSIQPARAGGLWLGRYRGGVSRVKGRAVARTYTTADGLGSNNVPMAMEDARGTLWAATKGGLSRLDGARFTTLTTRDGLPSNNLNALAADDAGALWIATGGAGVVRYVGGRFTTYGVANGLPDPLVWTLAPDSAGAVWVGTGAGLARVDAAGRVTAYGRRHGLPEGWLVGIVADDAGFLWLNYTNGLARASVRGLRDAAGGRPVSPTATTFGTLDGMRSADGTPSSFPSAARSPDGRLWFSTTKGVAAVDPRDLKRNVLPPPVHVEDVTADGRPLPRDGTGAVAPGTARLTLRYTAPSLRVPERVRFRYRLDGFDRNWIDAGPRRSAEYTALPPGEYQFRVRASNDDEVWAAADATVGFRVLPQWYQTGWFWALAAAVRARERLLRARFALVLGERTRLARELHDTLLQGFIGVTLQMRGAARRLAGDAGAELHAILDHADRTVADARGAVWDMRAPGLEHADLPTALGEAARALAAGSGVDVAVSRVGPARALPGPVETTLLRVGREAVANALQHARAGRVDVTLTYERDAVRLLVRDDGAGFAVEQATRGQGGHWGLLGMRERADRVGGTLRVESAPGAGTAVSLVVPAR